MCQADRPSAPLRVPSRLYIDLAAGPSGLCGARKEGFVVTCCPHFHIARQIAGASHEGGAVQVDMKMESIRVCVHLWATPWRI